MVYDIISAVIITKKRVLVKPAEGKSAGFFARWAGWNFWVEFTVYITLLKTP